MTFVYEEPTVRRSELSSGDMVLWTALGVGAGLVAGVVLSEWLGGVSRQRIQRAARRMHASTPTRLTTAAGARAAGSALMANPALQGLDLSALAISRGVVELRGWVTTRAERALAARVVRALPGIENVVNSILVHGEDDRQPSRDVQATDQPA
jgi:hypothetical protein